MIGKFVNGIRNYNQTYLTYLAASCFADGKGVVEDHCKSVAWYHKAAKQNDTFSQFNLGICYQEGRGVQKDPHKAAKWVHSKFKLFKRVLVGIT